jgi:hypothetical protein
MTYEIVYDAFKIDPILAGMPPDQRCFGTYMHLTLNGIVFDILVTAGSQMNIDGFISQVCHSKESILFFEVAKNNTSKKFKELITALPTLNMYKIIVKVADAEDVDKFNDEIDPERKFLYKTGKYLFDKIGDKNEI